MRMLTNESKIIEDRLKELAEEDGIVVDKRLIKALRQVLKEHGEVLKRLEDM